MEFVKYIYIYIVFSGGRREEREVAVSIVYLFFGVLDRMDLGFVGSVGRCVGLDAAPVRRSLSCVGRRRTVGGLWRMSGVLVAGAGSPLGKEAVRGLFDRKAEVVALIPEVGKDNENKRVGMEVKLAGREERGGR